MFLHEGWSQAVLSMSTLRENILTLFAATTLFTRAAAQPVPELDSATALSASAQTVKPTPWESAVGAGFRRSTKTLSLETGAAYGLAALGSHQAHDLALISLSIGRMGRTHGAGHWCRGNWEWRAELFGGGQFSPTSASLVGLTPHLRYNFATGTRLVPFLDFGAGVMATSIGLPDLSTRFEFNEQGTVGAHWVFRDQLALTVEVRAIHISNARIREPNNGVNSVMGMIGLTWFF